MAVAAVLPNSGRGEEGEGEGRGGEGRRGKGRGEGRGIRKLYTRILIDLTILTRP